MSTYDDASLITYPSGYKSGVIYSQKPTDGSGDLTFTRASTATRVNESGLIESVASGVPRIDYTGGGCGKFLFEPQRTNLWPYSQASSTWLKSFWTTTDNYALSPNGAVNAFRAVSTNNSGILYLNGTGTTGVNNTLSVYAKSNTGTNQNFRFFGNGNSTTSGEFVATTEWQRFTFTYNCTSTASGIKASSIMLSDLLFSDFQHEAGDYATSVIPTAGATSTRLVDTSTTTGLSSVIGQTEGVLYVEIETTRASYDSARIVQLDDGTDSNRVQLSILSGNVTGAVVTGGAVQAAIDAPFVLGVNKMAIAYKANDFAFYLNGVQVGVGASGSVPATSNLLLGFKAGTNSFGDSIKATMLFPTRLTNTKLATLTTL